VERSANVQLPRLLEVICETGRCLWVATTALPAAEVDNIESEDVTATCLGLTFATVLAISTPTTTYAASGLATVIAVA
jgi:hypothetical protein